MLFNLKIGTKLVGGFVLVSALMLGIGFYAVRNLERASAASAQMYETAAQPLGQLAELSTHYQRSRVHIRDVMLAPDRDAVRERRSGLAALNLELERHAKEFERLISTEQMRLEFATFDRAKAQFLIDVEQIGALKEADKHAEAMAAMAKAKPNGDLARDTLERMVNQATADAKRLAADTSQNASSATSSTVFAVVVTALLALGLGLLLTRSITGPLKKMMKTAENLAEGRVDERIDHVSEDETGQLADSFRRTIGYIQEVAKGAEALAAGDLDAQLKLRSEDDRLTRSFLSATNTVREMVGETQRLIGAAKQGNLATRGDPSRFKGSYADIVGGVNQMLDAVVSPVKVAADYVDRISRGEIPPPITASYQGDFDAIKSSLNRLIGHLHDLARGAEALAGGDLEVKLAPKSESDVLTRNFIKAIEAINSLGKDAALLTSAAVEGRLNARAEATRHQGAFRELIEGFNATFDYLVGYIDSMPLPAMIINRNLQVVYMNKKGLEVGGATVEQLRGMACASYFKTGDCNTDRCACRRAMSDGRPAKSETVARPRDGLALEIDYLGIPIRNRQGEVIGAFEVVIDQTEVRKAQSRARKVSDYQGAEVAKVQEALSKIAVGNLAVSLAPAPSDADTAECGRTFQVIDEAIGSVAHAVQALAADAKMLSASAVEGQLATRAEASRHQGDYRKIIEGVNATLDSVMGPVNAAISVLQEYASQNLQVSMTGDFTGDHAKIKQAVNGAGAALHEALLKVAVAVDQLASTSHQIASTSES
ncbi:MAG: MCP four helix bundle domain-containing protein, partial [Deltaproteobacteria bacterium]|nr:MCP four helix bundle domain-containing protein [Deltaproteobacteria bacterium]